MFHSIIFLLSVTYVTANEDIYNALWILPQERQHNIDIDHTKDYVVVQIVFEKCQFDLIDDEEDKKTNMQLISIYNNTKSNDAHPFEEECKFLSHQHNKVLYFSNGSKMSKTYDGRGIFWSLCTGKNLCDEILSKSHILVRLIKEKIGMCVCNVEVLKHSKLKFLPAVEVLWISGRSLD